MNCAQLAKAHIMVINRTTPHTVIIILNGMVEMDCFRRRKSASGTFFLVINQTKCINQQRLRSGVH